MFDRSPRFLDVRTPAEFESWHIPDSLDVPLDPLPELARQFADCREPTSVCRTGRRATRSVDGGPTFAGVTDACGMALRLARTPWSRKGAICLDSARRELRAP